MLMKLERLANWMNRGKPCRKNGAQKQKSVAMTAEPYVPSASFRRETPKIASLPFTAGPCLKPEQKVYTGSAIKGIGTMHKSNAVPIFSDEEAQDIAKMRR
jgi:hypothetical protein